MAEQSVLPSQKYTTKDIWKLTKFYADKIRAFPPSHAGRLIKQIQRLLDKGVEMDSIAIALENYEADEQRRRADPRYVLSIYTFFTEAKIQEWQTPRPSYKPQILTFDIPVLPPPPAPALLPTEEISDEL
jgi:hypothetical protein